MNIKTVIVTVACLALKTSAWVAPINTQTRVPSLALHMSDESSNISDESEPAPSSPPAVAPTTFREAEVLGLRLMQEGKHQEALEAFELGVKLPGSRPDIVRTKLVPGPSPVGGSMGGSESQTVMSLDEFELQAAHYNMACAHAQLGNEQESLANLKLAFDNGFDNYAAVRGDPDLNALQGSADFDELMAPYLKKKQPLGGGFKIALPKFDFTPPTPPSFPNPFGLFGKK